MRGNERLCRWAAEVLVDARAVYVGSDHIRGVLEDVVGPVDRVYEVPPGVDLDAFRPAPREVALPRLIAEAERDPLDGGERHPDPGNADRFERFFADDTPTVLYFGKLIENKGVQVLFEAMKGLDARALIVGFGDYRDELEALAPPGTLFTGALEHRHLEQLLPLVDVSVVPSIFPEAFGMVAAEAAAAGVPPVVADHSGLAEVAAGIAQEYPADRRGLVSFPNGDADALRERLRTLLELPAAERHALGLAARAAVERHWSWSRVAERLLEPFTV
jgi:glycosyltransferase involved in cell wall biosynthesis